VGLQNSKPEDIDKRLQLFLQLRNIIAEGIITLFISLISSAQTFNESKFVLHLITTITIWCVVEQAPSIFVEMKLIDIFLNKIKDYTNPDHQLMYMFALSDLVDVDKTGNLRLTSTLFNSFVYKKHKLSHTHETH
jgi:hypothetical protein